MRYPGQELELFAEARRWKTYLAALVRPYLAGRVLEVGAGLGATTSYLCDGSQREWTCLEPDLDMARRLQHAIIEGRLPRCCRALFGTTRDLSVGSRFEAILYIDVLEHIASDAAELLQSTRHLAPGGTVVVLSPAWPWLYSAFDAAIGHYRRYTRASLSAVVPRDLECVTLRYLDSVGLLASLGNRLVLHRAIPTTRTIALWDGYMVPVSRFLDPLLGFRVGRSLLGVWRANGSSTRACSVPSRSN